MASATTLDAFAGAEGLLAVQFALRIRDGRAEVVFVGDRLADLLGVDGAGVTGDRWLAPWLHPVDVAAALPDYALLAAEHEVECLLRVAQPQGGYRWIRQTCRLHEAGSAEDYRVAGLLVDGSRQHEREDAVRARMESDESQTRLAQIVDGSPVATFVLDREHRVTFWNHACEVLTGVSAASIIGTREQWRAFYPSERPVMADLIVDGESGGKVTVHYSDTWRRSELIKGAYEAESFFPNFGEKGVWLFFTAAPLRDANGEVTGAIETIQDVTERRVAEAALKQKAEEEALRTSSYFQEVLDNLPFGVLVLDIDLNTVYWNGQVENLFDLPDSFIHKDMSISKIVRRIAENGCYGPGDIEEQVASRVVKLCMFQEHSVELTRPGGGTLLVRGAPVVIDGEPVGLILLQEDITERKQDEQLARQRDMEKSLAVLRNAVGNISQGISLMDDDLNLVVCNHRFLELLDLPEFAGAPGTNLVEVLRYNAERGEFGEVDPDALVSRQLARARRLEPYVIERTRPNGRIIEYIGKPLPDGGFVVTYTDITERKQNEIALREFNITLERKIAERTEALQKALKDLGSVIENLEQTQDEQVRSENLAALGSMVAGVAHELNTPIGNSLMVASHLVGICLKMKESIKTGLKKSVLDEFIESTDSAGDVLVRNLGKAAELVSSFKQVAVDQTSSQRRSFQLAEMVAEVVTSVGPTIRKTPFIVEQNIADDISMDSYPGPLGQVVTNLINNGIIHGFDGRKTGRICIEAEKPAGDGQLVLKIRDDGNGIPADILPRIFDPFFTTRLGQGGSGLGLNIVHNVVFGVLGGRINVESVPGEGTCFTLVLPLLAPEQAVAITPLKPKRRTGDADERVAPDAPGSQ